MLPPKRSKFRKHQKGRTKGKQGNQSTLSFGRFGIKSCESTRLKLSTVEAVRRVITRKFKRSGQVWVRVFPDLNVSAKPLEVRMGKGKGSPSYWACRVKAGQLLYEIDGVSISLAKQAAAAAACKLPVNTQFCRYT